MYAFESPEAACKCDVTNANLQIYMGVRIGYMVHHICTHTCLQHIACARHFGELEIHPSGTIVLARY